MKIQRDLNGLRTFLDADFAHLYGMLADQWSGRSDVDAYQVRPLGTVAAIKAVSNTALLSG